MLFSNWDLWNIWYYNHSMLGKYIWCYFISKCISATSNTISNGIFCQWRKIFLFNSITHKRSILYRNNCNASNRNNAPWMDSIYFWNVQNFQVRKEY